MAERGRVRRHGDLGDGRRGAGDERAAMHPGIDLQPLGRQLFTGRRPHRDAATRRRSTSKTARALSTAPVRYKIGANKIARPEPRACWTRADCGNEASLFQMSTSFLALVLACASGRRSLPLPRGT